MPDVQGEGVAVEGIQQMFSELAGYEEYQLDLFCHLLRQREAAKQWARENPARSREHARQSMARKYATDAEYRERHKAAVKARQKERYRTDPAFRERMLEHARRQHQRRAEQRAA